MGTEEIKKKGVRIALDAESLISHNSVTEEEILSLNKKFISLADVESLLGKREKAKEEAWEHSPDARPRDETAEVSRAPSFKPIAREYSPELKVREALDVTGQSRTEGGVEDFVAYFRNRYERISALLRSYGGEYPEAELQEIRKLAGQEVRTIVMVSEMRETKKGNLLLDVEDLTGQFKVVISQKDENLFHRARNLVRDDIVLVYGKVSPAFLIAEGFEWPDIPVARERKAPERDLAGVYLSDLHFGSKQFLGQYFNRFTDWVNGKGENQELAGKVKYIFVAGDIVDGIGIYPNQEKDLDVLDVFKQ